MAFVRLTEVSDGEFYINVDKIIFLSENRSAEDQTVIKYGSRHDECLVVEGRVEDVVVKIEAATLQAARRDDG
ncbi:hypothetical protein BKE38_12450 [Pseudoroseomonas deserti]|uniref:Uncharacterized protein n=1 Tax=Teichococcus deserti TaxID=1817963 RepID=A0A1V2H3A0_9PROT|nr:hypothetical protein [Pseudoroseomonas deserti]ONG53330.1 hypothetical protein BKE38_12450 [Pseudoroseomonas deserti]